MFLAAVTAGIVLLSITLCLYGFQILKKGEYQFRKTNLKLQGVGASIMAMSYILGSIVLLGGWIVSRAVNATNFSLLGIFIIIFGSVVGYMVGPVVSSSTSINE